MDRAPEHVQANYCATLVDQWIELGVRHAVIAPGSRSTPMALAIVDRPELSAHVVHDERSAAFVALGLGLGGAPALLLCTSGTAAANFFPAVVEANLSEVPMIVLTADRPEELRGVGAPQTIDQVELYGGHVRWFRDPGVADASERSLWRELAVDAWVHAASGPVQLNLAFREPLLGEAGPLPEPIPAAAVTARATGGIRRSDPVPDIECERGVIVVGGRSGCGADEVAALRELTGWPVIADPLSGMRHLDGAVSVADALLRHEAFADDHLPDVIVRVGRPAASKVLAQWTHRAAVAGATLIQVGGPGVIDPDHDVSAVCSMSDLLARRRASSRSETTAGESEWAQGWARADRLGNEAITAALGHFDEISEPIVARSVASHLPDGAELTVASSMPVRDLEWFGGASARAHANRGANGIDGVTSTALGIALGGRASFVLIGDLAFVHDSSALVGLLARGTDLRIIVIDNDGGGIFSFLPQASALDPERFEQLFGTPMGVDIVAMAAAHGLESRSVETVDELIEQIPVPGPWVACIPSDRQRNVRVHSALHRAVAERLDAEFHR